MNSYEKLIKESTNMRVKAKGYRKIGEIYMKKKKREDAVTMFKQAIEKGDQKAHAMIG